MSALALLVAACQDTPQPFEVDQTPVFAAATAGSAATTGKYLVLLKSESSLPADFAASVGALGGTLDAVFPDAGIAVVSGLTAARAQSLARRSDIAAVEPDLILQLDPVQGLEVAPFEDPDSPSSPGSATRYARQWNMRAIKADQAWAAGYLGSSAVTLAILDTGIDYLYPELAGRVDLARSISLIPGDDAILNVNFPGRHPISDMYFHGTHVSTIAVSNSYILAGVTTQVTLMGVKICSYQGSCPTSAVLTGILYASDAGADVINLSLGGAFSKVHTQGFHSLINRVMAYAQRHDVLVVVSAGNTASDLDHDGNSYKAYCSAPNVVCVAATGPTASGGTTGPWTNVDAPAAYTNYGRSAISVAAPGGTGAGYVWSACSSASLAIPVCQTGTYILGATGTSMAAPHVAGVAALLVGTLGKNPQNIRAVLQQTADDINQPGTDPYAGKGRVNVARAVGLY